MESAKVLRARKRNAPCDVDIVFDCESQTVKRFRKVWRVVAARGYDK